MCTGAGAGSGSTGFRRRFRRRFQEALGAKPSQVQRFRRRLQKPSQVRFILPPEFLAEVFPALGFAARFRKICKNKMPRLLGISLKLFFTEDERECSYTYTVMLTCCNCHKQGKGGSFSLTLRIEDISKTFLDQTYSHPDFLSSE